MPVKCLLTDGGGNIAVKEIPIPIFSDLLSILLSSLTVGATKSAVQESKLSSIQFGADPAPIVLQF